MPIQPFHQSDTFVAFMDIAGFKAMMSDGQRAPLALDAFYSAGYSVLNDHQQDDILVNGFFVSDCGVLFVRGEDKTPTDRLVSLCRIVREIHRRTFERAIQLTTSIAWGEFSYHERIEFPGIEKNPIYGNAYVTAFADNENGTPKLYPNECRLKRSGLPQGVTDFCINKNGQIAEHMRAADHHFYFEWMRP